MKYTITQSRLLYVMSIDDRKHKDYLKIGEVFVDNTVADSSDNAVREAAVREILSKRSYMQGVDYKIEFAECTTYNQDSQCYKADDVHRTLSKTLSVTSKAFAKIKKEDADIWFRCTLDEVKLAIETIKYGNKVDRGEIKFRPEQNDAINRTVAYFTKEFKDDKKGKNFLWNAKMRFGKTICGLEVARRCDYKSTLIVTHRPVVDKGWQEDFKYIFGEKRRKCTEEFFAARPPYVYASCMEEKSEGGDFYDLRAAVDAGKKRLIYFVSMQYLRLSQFVGGKEQNFDPLKQAIMEYDWDFVMVDEAHEGIDAAAGVRVMEKLRKGKTRILSLSGTPFNLLDKYEESEIYTWDYVMEQHAKLEWDDIHYGDPNPYAELPRMQILTFYATDEAQAAAHNNNESFKFHEFFRVWTDKDKDVDASLIDHFVHEADVKRFLDRLVKRDDKSCYPFSDKEFRKNFRHTFWLLPGVKEAKALQDLLENHNTFKNFKIINVAGDGNIEDNKGKALNEVLDNIHGNKKKNILPHEYTITLSCGKLTTGVTVREWTAVLNMKGSDNTPAANYMQTIFRVQSTAVLRGRQKSNCYVFDFAPSRALTAVAETAKMAVYARTEKGKGILKLSQAEEKKHLESFIKLCPIISMEEGKMEQKITANEIFEKLKNVYIERAVRSGYGDNCLYDSKTLLQLTPEQEKVLGDVHDLLGSLPNQWKPDKIIVNDGGLKDLGTIERAKTIYYLSAENVAPATPSMSAQRDDKGCPTTDDDGWDNVMTLPSPLFPYLFVAHSALKDGEWSDFTQPVLWKRYTKPKDKTEEQRQREDDNRQKRARMSVLRGVAIRIPLLVYGADINYDDNSEITINNFADIIDQASWEEFMPKGFTKETFRILKDCFDPTVFTGAAKRIADLVTEADNLTTEDRIFRIATIFSYFHNPDKETVLTPWRVVNMQLSDTLGGWCFQNEQFDGDYVEENSRGEIVRTARRVDRGQVTKDVFGDYNSRILEINSKTGLYPLYMAYSIFREKKEPTFREYALTGERGVGTDAEHINRQALDDIEIWKDVLQENIFVVCRTPMAVSITKRTLVGSPKNDFCINVKCYDDMINVLRTNPEQFEHDVVRGKDFWHLSNTIQKSVNEDINNMKFKAVVGNPPYQESKSSEKTKVNGAFASAIYPSFVQAAINIAPNYISLITPSRWMTKIGQGISNKWVEQMVKSNHFEILHDFLDANDCFEKVEIKGGVNYFLYTPNYNGKCNYVVHNHGEIYESFTFLDSVGAGVVIRDEKANDIIRKIVSVEGEYFINSTFTSYVSPKHFFDKNELLSSNWTGYETLKTNSCSVKLYVNRSLDSNGFGWINPDIIPRNKKSVKLHKVYIPKAGGSGNDPIVLGTPFYGEPGSVCSYTYLVIGYDPKTHNLSKTECENIIKYIRSCFFRYLVSIKKKTQDNAREVFQFVPLQDFTPSSDIDWSKPVADIDRQLYKKYGLTDEEVAFIERMIKPME